MISQSRIDLVRSMLNNKYSIEDIAINLGVKNRSARRYIRLARAKSSPQLNKMSFPKILLLDIETATMTIETWGILYKQRPQPHQILEEWFCLAWAAKWLFDSNIMSDIVTPLEAIQRDDSRILKGIWELLEEADIICAHNGQNFDIRKMNARFIKHGVKPPLPYQIIDTLKVARRHFAFSSYSLEYLCNFLGLTPKMSTSYHLWKGCLAGDKKAMEEMNKYNERDIVCLEDLYLKLRPWMKSHPNVALYSSLDIPVCTNCGGEDLEFNGFYYTPAGRFQSGRCGNCGAIFRSRYSDLTKEERENLLISAAR